MRSEFAEGAGGLGGGWFVGLGADLEGADVDEGGERVGDEVGGREEGNVIVPEEGPDRGLMDGGVGYGKGCEGEEDEESGVEGCMVVLGVYDGKDEPDAIPLR